jgi:multidrug efflux pump subunit AcrB
MSPFEIPVRRPVLVAMLFLAIVLLGLIGWSRISIELIPELQGDELTVQFVRPGSEPEVVERELLLPLAARVSGLPEVAESWGEVRGGRGHLRVRFERGADLKVRQLDLQRVAAALARAQPPGTFVDVQSQDTSVLSRFVMIVHATHRGGEPLTTLHDIVEERVSPRLASVPGVSQVLLGGGASLQVNVDVDPDRAAARGLGPLELITGVWRSVERLRFVGDLDEGRHRMAVVLDARPAGPIALARTRLDPARPILLGHVADVAVGPGREYTLFRLNGRPSVGLVIFQESGANLVRLGRALRQRLRELGKELEPLGLELTVGFDGARLVEEQIDRLLLRSGVGFGIGLVVLYLFLLRVRAVLVVAVAVPVSLLAALAAFYVAGLSLNLISVFGLAVGVGLLVDNSVVVYEAVQRQLERGRTAAAAAVAGVRRTVRAIFAASLAMAVVFLPVALVDLEQPMMRSLLGIVAASILLPLFASLLVAVGLVPLLARRLSAPAALRRLGELRARRERCGGLRAPDRPQALLTGLLKVALRRPVGWLAGLVMAILLTVLVAVSWLAVSMIPRPAEEANEVRLSVRLPASHNLAASSAAFQRLEEALLALEGVSSIEGFVQEGGGSLTVKLVEKERRPRGLSTGRVRRVAGDAARELQGVEVLVPEDAEESAGEGGEGPASLFGQGPAEIVLSGPDHARLQELAEEVRSRLESIPEVKAWLATSPGQEELRAMPDRLALASFGLTADQVLPALRLVGRDGVEMPAGLSLASGRELPVVVRRDAEGSGPGSLRRLRVTTPSGVLPLGALVSLQRMPAPPVIRHHNGRREARVLYRLQEGLEQSGPARAALGRRIASAMRQVFRPEGYTLEVGTGEDRTEWFKELALVVVLLLYLLLAIVFESLTLPVLVLLSLPLTLLGATWALVLAGMPLDRMALVGALALMGLTVNPAILLVDRMQQRVRSGGQSAGAAALAAVRERTRPVLMTAGTTIAGLWPLSLVTGRENEIWPPFATIVMGGLITSTLLTLLVMPVGFVILRRLDVLFGRLGPWVMIVWIALTTGVMTALIRGDVISTLTWQVATTLLLAGALLGIAVLAFRRPELPTPRHAAGPPALEVRGLAIQWVGPGGSGTVSPARSRRAAGPRSTPKMPAIVCRPCSCWWRGSDTWRCRCSRSSGVSCSCSWLRGSRRSLRSRSGAPAVAPTGWAGSSREVPRAWSRSLCRGRPCCCSATGPIWPPASPGRHPRPASSAWPAWPPSSAWFRRGASPRAASPRGGSPSA